MISFSFPLIIFLLDSSLSYVLSSLVYKYYPIYFLETVWLVHLIKVPLLRAVSQKLPCPWWIPSTLLYVLTLCLAPALHQTLRLLLFSQAPELHSGLANSLLYHLPLSLSCLLWDLLSPLLFPEEDPEEDSNGKKKERENFIRLVMLSKADWPFLSFAFMFLALALLLELSIPYYMGRVIDILSSYYKETEFLSAIFFMSFFSVTSSLSAGCRGGLFMFSMSRLKIRLQKLLFGAFAKQDIAFFEANKTGEITSRLSNDTSLVSRSIAGNVNITLRMFVKCVGHYYFMILVSWKLTLLTLISTPLIWIVQSLYNKYHQDLVKKVQDSIATSSDLAKEIIETVETVKSFAAEEEEGERYDEALRKTHRLQCHRDLVRAVYLLAFRSVNLGTQVAMFVYGHKLIQSGAITNGQMVSFMLYQIESGDYLRSLFHMFSEITHSAGVATKVFQYLDQKPQVSRAGSLCPENLDRMFEFKNVTFSYPSCPDTPALKDVSFTLKPGTVTGIVGLSGGGKTTCVALLERFYEPQSGKILLDGRPLAEYKHEYLHSKVALVAQDPVLFAGTVRENIAYGLDRLSEKQLVKAARLAKADAFIEKMENGYDTDVGSSGAQLAAGQKQRIALARALARHPKLLILDEASRCLDVDTEDMIQQSLQSIPDLTVLIIAHRLRAVKNADQILVLEGGQLVESGTHDELVERQGAYYKLHQNQE
ncbi:PREDICTED: antigen peptide transporter 2 [Nanorana parkeri]|uniref:antigen peptide transporter 2 n=1 Tax=Nanorana parkeri TaxID=125878 RepID=UPI0008549409|nr:PREDICTED: antigen peptide transporter 2 [Nanorana parkeri]XP_018413652.1 PREDICTED: antigen peptide transporter 2 [Nanorana parkeri]